jgi:ankyrin repeat protein
MTQAQDKLLRGLKLLTKAENDLDFLGLAIGSIHGALEDHFRDLLESSSRVPSEQCARVRDPHQVKWRELTQLMQEYHGLSNDEKNRILWMNSLRNTSAHGDIFTGTYSQVKSYADFVRSLMNKYVGTNNTKTASSRPNTSNSQTPPHSSSARSTNTSSNYSQADDLREYSDEEFSNLQGDVARPSTSPPSSSGTSNSNTPFSAPNRSSASNPKESPRYPYNVTIGNAPDYTQSSSKKRIRSPIVLNSAKVKGCLSKVFGAIVIVSISSIPLVWFHHLVSQQSTSSNSKNADRTLRDAAGKCDLELTKIALREGGKPNAIDDGFFSSKETALTKAIETSPLGKKVCLPVIKLLLDKKANPNLQGSLHLAAQNADLDVIKLLLKKGANPNLDFKSDGIPLSWFIKRHRTSLDSNYGAVLDKASANRVLSTLLSPFNSNINRQDKNGDTLLIKLIKDDANSAFVIQKIIKLGLNPKQKNKEGKTAYDYAFAKNQDPKVIKLLNKYR